MLLFLLLLFLTLQRYDNYLDCANILTEISQNNNYFLVKYEIK